MPAAMCPRVVTLRATALEAYWTVGRAYKVDGMSATTNSAALNARNLWMSSTSLKMTGRGMRHKRVNSWYGM